MKYFAILPQTTSWDIQAFIHEFNAKKVSEGFSYNSNNNEEWESIESLRELIKEHVDQTFEI